MNVSLLYLHKGNQIGYGLHYVKYSGRIGAEIKFKGGIKMTFSVLCISCKVNRVSVKPNAFVSFSKLAFEARCPYCK